MGMSVVNRHAQDMVANAKSVGYCVLVIVYFKQRS